MADQSYTYKMTDGRSEKGLISAIRECLSLNEKMETQLTSDGSGNSCLQARAINGKWKQLVGMDKAITIRFKAEPGKIRLEIGEAKWADKGTVLAVSMFVLWPLTISSGVGIYKQSRLPEKIKNIADIYMDASNCIEENKKPLISESTATKFAHAFQKLVR